MTTACKPDAGLSGRTLPSLTPIDIGQIPTGSCLWGGSACGDTWAHRVANPESGLRWGLAASLPMSNSRFILLGARRGEKRPPFIFSGCSRNFQVITVLVLQQPHTAVTLISLCDIWRNWVADIKGLAEYTHVVNSGAWLAFQDWSCCGMFGDRIKLIWGPWRHSRASGIQTGKLEAWEVRGHDKWVLTLGGLWESNKIYGLPPAKYLSSSPLSLSLSYTLTQRHIYAWKWIPQAVIS